SPRNGTEPSGTGRNGPIARHPSPNTEHRGPNTASRTITFDVSRYLSISMACSPKPRSDPDALIPVRVIPRASRDELVGWREGTLVLRLAAPPVEGAANRACQKFLARILAVSPSSVSLEAGEKSRDKRFRVA